MTCSACVTLSLNDLYYEEFLEKQRRVKAWSWKNYWFVLEGDQLSYYKDRERKISRGLIDLALAKTVRACAAPTKGFPFEILTSSRSHTLSARTVELRDKWVELCGKAMLLSFRRSRSMHRPSCDSISDDDLPDSVLEDLQNAFQSDSMSPNNSGSIVPYSQSTPNTPVAPHPSRASRSRSNEEQDTDYFEPSKVNRRRMCRKTKSELQMGGADGSSEKMVLKASRSNTSSSSMSTEDDEVFSVADTPPDRPIMDTPVVSNAVLRRNIHMRAERTKGTSNGTSSSSSLWSNTASSISSTSTIAEDTITKRESSLSYTLTTDDIPDDVCQSKADTLEKGPLATINFTQSRIPSLPYPRLELVNKSVEDLRGCIARIRKPDEVFAKPHPNELGGKAMAKLKIFLNYLDERGSNGLS